MNTFNTPNAVQVATQQNYLASNTIYDIRKPQIGSKEAKVWGSQDVTGLIDLLGGKNYVASSFYRHFEEDRIHAVITANNDGGGNTFFVANADVMNPFPDAVYDPYTALQANAGPLMPVRKHDVLVLPGTDEVQVWVTSVNLGAQSFDVTAFNGAAIPAYDSDVTIINIGNVEPEVGGKMPDTMNFRDDVYYNVTAIQADTFSTTGSALTEMTWVPFTANGVTEYSWFLKGYQSTYKRFRNFREIKGVISKKTTSNSTADAVSPNTPTMTEGILPFAQSYGNNTTYDIGTGLTLDRWNTLITDQVDKNKGATENSEWMGINVRAAIESFIRTEMKNGGISYGAFEGDAKKAVDFGFDSFQTLGYTNHCMTYQLFNDPTLLGADGHNFKYLLMGIPMERGIYKLGDTKEATDVPSLRMNFKKLGNTSREWEEFPLGGTGGVYTTGDDVKSINFRTEFGMECFGKNRFFTVQGLNQ